MKIMSWNCHYGLSKEKLDKIFALNDIDIYVIQECKKNDIDSIFTHEGNYWHGDSTESGGDPDKELGVAVFSKNEKICIRKASWLNEVVDYRYVVPYIIKNKESGEECVIANVWTKGCDKNNLKYKNYHEPIFKAFKTSLSIINEQKIIVMGDFNTGSEVNAASAKWYANLKTLFTSNNFVNCSADKEYSPTYFKGNGSWLDDHCFIKRTWETKYKLKFGDKEDWISATLSDHIPMFLEI